MLNNDQETQVESKIKSAGKAKDSLDEIRRFTIQLHRKIDSEPLKKLEEMIDFSKTLKQSKKPNTTDILKLAISKITTEDVEKLAENLLTSKEKVEMELRKIMLEETGSNSGDVFEFLLTSPKAKNHLKKLQ